MIISSKKDEGALITLLFFTNAILEIFSEAFSLTSIIVITKPLISILLMILYFYSSTKNDVLFYITISLSLITNLLYIPNSKDFLFYALIVYTFHKIFLLIMIFKIVKVTNFIPFFIATIPLSFIFFYLFVSSDIPENSYYLIFFHNLLAGILGGIAISSYMMNDTKQNSILLICALLFLMLQLVVYIEKYYLVNQYYFIFRPLAMTLNVMAYYVFCKFVIASEKLNHN